VRIEPQDSRYGQVPTPLACLQNAKFFVTGTLGLAYPTTGEAMQKAVALAKEGPCEVSTIPG